MAVELENLNPHIWAGVAAETLEEALKLLETCGRTLRQTLASVAELDDDATQLVLATLPPGSEALLHAAAVIASRGERIWLTPLGELVVELAHADAETKDPGGSQRRKEANAARARVLDRVAAAKAAGTTPVSSPAWTNEHQVRAVAGGKP